MSERYLWTAIVVLCISAMGIAQIYAEVFDDPTRPPGFARPASLAGKSDARISWELSAIKIDKNRKMAILNGQRVKEGQWIHSAYIVAIEPDLIKLKTESGLHVVRLVEQQVKKTFR